MNYRNEISRVKKEKNAIILAHYYQVDEIQEIADYVEDSLGLSQRAAATNADIIVFAGVKFMAETAKILNPEKKVLLPDMNAGCSLADSCKYEDFKKFIDDHPGHKVVSYINCSAEVKTLSDVICTSGNAVDIVNSFPAEQKILFAPDKNLGSYINKVTGRNMLLWDGVCKIHDVLTAEKILEMKLLHRDAKIIAHPECKAVILEMADFVGSTAKMIKFVISDNAKKYIVATESGILYQMRKDCPEKEFIIVPADESCRCNDCEYMKLITMEKLFACLLSEEPEIILEEEVMMKAKIPILRMLEITASVKK
jgi:quinolinate synthase